MLCSQEGSASLSERCSKFFFDFSVFFSYYSYKEKTLKYYSPEQLEKKYVRTWCHKSQGEARDLHLLQNWRAVAGGGPWGNLTSLEATSQEYMV